MLVAPESSVSPTASPRGMLWHQWRHMRRALHTLGHRQPWWVALGQGSPQGLFLAGTFRPWTAPQEWGAWQFWQRGGHQEDAVRTLIATFQDYPPWFVNVSYPFYMALRTGMLPIHWDDPLSNPNGAFLRWVPEWPWDASRHGWVDNGRRRSLHPLPGFERWAMATTPDQPLSFGQWYRHVSAEDHDVLPYLLALIHFGIGLAKMAAI